MGKNNDPIKYGSKAYRKAYNKGTVTRFSKKKNLHTAKDLPEATAIGKAPMWLKAKREFEKNNPKPKDATQGPKKALGIKSSALNEWEANRDKHIVKAIEKYSNINGRDIDHLNKLSIKEQQYLAADPKYQTSYYKDFQEGVKTLGTLATSNNSSIERMRQIQKDNTLTTLEKKEKILSYIKSPKTSLAADALGTLAPLTIPAKMVQAPFRNDYSMSDAAKGKKNDANMLTDVLTDPLILTGTGAVPKMLQGLSKAATFSKFSKAANVAAKTGELANIASDAKPLITASDDIAKKATVLPKPNNFKSEIDWTKWVKDNNPTYDAEDLKAIKKNSIEYDKIEKATKADGTWMKDSDGSDFKGTKEQFIQQNSENFKKFYKKSLIKNSKGNPLIMYHGSPNTNIKTFLRPTDEGYVKSPTTTTGGGGIYFSDRKKYADLYQNFDENPNAGLGKTYETYLSPKTSLTILEKESDLINDIPISFLWKHNEVPTDAVKAGTYAINKYPAGLEVAMHKPNLIKSAKGNNGNFDMTNPNFYKALTVPVLGTALGIGATNSENETIYKNGGQINNMKYTKRNMGGAGNVLQAAAPFIGMIPGYGQIAAPIMSVAGSLMEQNQLKKDQNAQEVWQNKVSNYNTNKGNNPYAVMNDGGQLTHFEGPSHEQGGIKLPQMGVEVEGEENMNNDTNYINSNNIGYDKDGFPTMNPKMVKTTFAKRAKAIESKYKNKNSFEEIMGEKLMQKQVNKDNEMVRPKEENPQMMNNGGYIKANNGLPPANYLDSKSFTIDEPNFPKPTPIGLDPDYVKRATTPAVKVPSSNPFADGTLGDKMNLIGGGIGALAQIPALMNGTKVETARTITPNVDYGKYNEMPELTENRNSFLQYQNNVQNNTSNSSTANARLLAGLSSTQKNNSNVLRNKQNQDYGRMMNRNQILNQAQQYNSNLMSRVDEQNTANEAANLYAKQQATLNIGQQVATTGQYFNELDNQKMQLKLLNELYSKYGLTSTKLKELLASPEMTNYKG